MGPSHHLADDHANLSASFGEIADIRAMQYGRPVSDAVTVENKRLAKICQTTWSRDNTHNRRLARCKPFRP
jgi:hypothetical protein